MTDSKTIIENKLSKEKNNCIASVNLEKETVSYSEKIKQHRKLKSLTGDEEVVRAFLLDRLVNELDYKPENLEIEKPYTIKGGHTKINPRIDILVKDEIGNPFFFIELKAPNKFEADKLEIDGQLFALAEAEERDFRTKVRYLVYYTTKMLENNNEVVDRAIIIDFYKYKTYTDWENDGFISIGSELTPGYGEPKKQPLIKGDEKHDLKVGINREEITGLGRNLHNVLWGGGGTNDSEIFYSLVNIILAKIQDEYEKEEGQEYDFQVYQYGHNVENPNKFYDRINGLYKRALKEQLNVSEQQKDDSVINQKKFGLNKLFYTVQSLETFSFLEGRSSLDGKDILGDFFESITRDGFKQNKGQFFTPTPIVNFLIYALQLDNLAIERLNNDRELPLIIDPSAGSGTFLVETMKIITKELKYKQRDKLKSSRNVQERFEELFMPDRKENKWAREYLYASEINFDLGTAAKVNMILHGDGSTNIFVKDGLLPFRFYVKETKPNYMETSNPEILYKDKEVNAKFDVVISNPPFSVDLDTQTQREVKNTFLFGDSKNSENLFIERYYQMLKEGGRLGVVLPESVFDTNENKYIRLFLFKYFNIKAVVSLPQITFQPFTSTKTSLLFAQKKIRAQVEKWNELWEKYGKEWSLLKTRMNDYNQYFMEGKFNKKWAKDVVKDIEENNTVNILKNIRRFLKDYIAPEDNELEIKELLTKYSDEIVSISKHEKETDAFGFYNAWWVFGEVTKEREIDCSIFMAQAENVGYKRTKRGVNPMPNDLYDIEYAPAKLDCQKVLTEYDKDIKHIEDKKAEAETEKTDIEKKNRVKENATTQKKIDKLIEDIENYSQKLTLLKAEKTEVENILVTYYENDSLKEEYTERTDNILINYFKNGLLSRYKSEDILLRKTSQQTILDAIRQEVVWS